MNRIKLLIVLGINIIYCLSATAIDEESFHTRVFRVDRGRSKRDISTRKEGKHEQKATFSLDAFNKKWILDVKQNSIIHNHHHGILLRSFDENDELIQRKEFPESCYYHGSVRGIPNSDVALNTCEGVRESRARLAAALRIQTLAADKVNITECIQNELRGHIQTDDDEFFIDPVVNDVEDIHKVTRSSKDDPLTSDNIIKGCGAKRQEEQYDTSYVQDGSKSLRMYRQPNETEQQYQERIGRQLVHVEKQYFPYLKTNKTRYIELFLVADNMIYQRLHNDTNLVLRKVLAMVNAVDRRWSVINIRVVLVGLEIWTNGDRMPRSDKSGDDLGSYGKYWRENIRGLTPTDVSHFLSHRGWKGGVIGLAWIPVACSTNSPTAVDLFRTDRPTGAHGVLSHEMAHNFNMGHDSGDCKCLSHTGGCTMGAGGPCYRCGFSDCNMKTFNRRSWHCINNYPKSTRVPQCGNGIVEKGEECDCGSPEMCKKKDPCCQPYNCVLKREVQCSDFSTPDCCKNCLFKRQGTMCRKSSSECDVPEYCTGDSAVCPVDSYIKDGSPCSDSIQVLPASGNLRRVQTSIFKPAIEARYVRINPRLSRPNHDHCMKLEILTCPSKEASAHSPTPIATKDLYDQPSLVLAPEILSCNYTGDVLISYRRLPLSDCEAPHIQFILEPNGVLRHQCTGKLVCIGGDKITLIISNKCTIEDSKFVRTEGSSLKHVRTGNCINSYDNRPHNGDFARIKPNCDSSDNRNRLDFLVQECMLPAGLESGTIPDSAITSNSEKKQRNFVYKSRYGRLWTGGGVLAWCSAKRGERHSYIQIDLGKVKKVGGVKVQGWVTAYWLYYSHDGIHWKGYTKGGKNATKNSYCINGNCMPSRSTQCSYLWDIGAKSANETCWKKLNTEAKGFGTCHPRSNKSCGQKDIYCGQLQCSSQNTNPRENYGSNYHRINIAGGDHCSAASITIKKSDEFGLGMVSEGTKCGHGKMCSSFQCKSTSELNIKRCTKPNGLECAGKGVCTNSGKCYCYGGYDEKNGCQTLRQPRDGGYGRWSSWTKCTRPCNGGKRRRHRFCNLPFPAHGGKDCQGPRVEEENCNVHSCPHTRSCKQLMIALKSKGKHLVDGVYTIYPDRVTAVKAYCDMHRQGGGWTLLVSSHTNKWTAGKVHLNNKDNPNLYHDYSILKYADQMKNNYLIKDDFFEYRLEAQRFGKYGGIWKAPAIYSFLATTPSQRGVMLVKKFDQWHYKTRGVQKRMPYIYKARLTTSHDPVRDNYGSITDNNTHIYPAHWMSGHNMLSRPEHIWYWMREGDLELPKSCLDILHRGTAGPWNPSGKYMIQTSAYGNISTYCDMDLLGGGWTLILNKVSNKGWTEDNVLKRKIMDTSLNSDYSIYGVGNEIKSRIAEEDLFQYMVEADGRLMHGGVFMASKSANLLNATPENVRPKLLQKFGTWNDGKDNLAKRVPYVTNKCGIYLTTSSSINCTINDQKPKKGAHLDTSGSIVTNDSIHADYLTAHPKPTIIRIWIREAGSRKSCNDIKLHGEHKGISGYKDSIYFVQGNSSSIIPVYCDMTSNESAWTLIVTSNTNNWTESQVLSRNVRRPSLVMDYSILKFANKIKNLTSLEKFKYKIEAYQRGHWGGIFEAPKGYTFIGKTNKMTNVKLLVKFDAAKWTFNRRDTLNNRMPYIGNYAYRAGLLTTSHSERSYWYGTIVSANTQYHPAPYINVRHALNPGTIWYWVNEDDCGPHRKAVNGRLSTWSMWTPCIVVCGNGTQERFRSCNSPVASCGGKPCDESASLHDIRSCSGDCPITAIKSFDDQYCVEPANGGCNVTDNTNLVWRKGMDKCKERQSKFIFDSDTGTIIHQCSGKLVCPKDGKVQRNSRIVISSTCPKMTLDKHFMRTHGNTVQFKDYCIHPIRHIHDKQTMVLWPSCFGENRYIMDFYEIAHGQVHASLWNNLNRAKSGFSILLTDPRYLAGSPTQSGHLDNFDTPYNIGSNYGMRLWTYFLVPETGYYTFVAAADDMCQVFLSTSRDPKNKLKIIEVSSYTSRYQFEKYPQQKSKRVFLQARKYYYLEGIFIEYGGGDHFTVGVHLPSGRSVIPINKHYLRSHLPKDG